MKVVQHGKELCSKQKYIITTREDKTLGLYYLVLNTFKIVLKQKPQRSIIVLKFVFYFVK